MKVAIIKLPEASYEDMYDEEVKEVFWENSELIDVSEVTEKEFEDLKEFMYLCRYNPRKYKATRNSVFSDRSYRLIIIAEKQLAPTFANMRAVALEIAEKENEETERKSKAKKNRDDKKEATALKRKKTMLAKLKEELE